MRAQPISILLWALQLLFFAMRSIVFYMELNDIHGNIGSGDLQ